MTHHWKAGDRVRIRADAENDHPEDPIGEVSMITANGGVLVIFPSAGAEVRPPEELEPSDGAESGR